MKNLIENWNKFLYEGTAHYEMEVSLKIQADLQLYGAVFDQIRAIPGITIVKSSANVKNIPGGTKIASLNIKFLMTPGTGAEYLSFVKGRIEKIKDAEGDKVLGVRIVKVPEKTRK